MKRITILFALMLALLLAACAKDAPPAENAGNVSPGQQSEQNAGIEIPDSYAAVPVYEALLVAYDIYDDFTFSFEYEACTSLDMPVHSLEDAFLAAAKLTTVINEAEFEIPYSAKDSYRLIRIHHGAKTGHWEFQFAAESLADQQIEAGSIQVTVDGNTGDILKWRQNFSEEPYAPTTEPGALANYNREILKGYTVIDSWETAMDVGIQLKAKLKLKEWVLSHITRATEENAWTYFFCDPDLLNMPMMGGGLDLVLNGEDCTIVAAIRGE